MQASTSRGLGHSQLKLWGFLYTGLINRSKSKSSGGHGIVCFSQEAGTELLWQAALLPSWRGSSDRWQTSCMSLLQTGWCWMINGISTNSSGWSADTALVVFAAEGFSFYLQKNSAIPVKPWSPKGHSNPVLSSTRYQMRLKGPSLELFGADAGGSKWFSVWAWPTTRYMTNVNVYQEKRGPHQPLSMIITNNVSGLPEHGGFTSIQFLAISI